MNKLLPGPRQYLEQRHDRELLLFVKGGADSAQGKSATGPGKANVFDYAEPLLQSKTPPPENRIFEPYGIRSWISLSECQQDQDQLVFIQQLKENSSKIPY